MVARSNSSPQTPNDDLLALNPSLRPARATLPRGDCRVPGCQGSGARALCRIHTLRARARGLDVDALDRKQLAALAVLLNPPRPKFPCRVPDCRGAGLHALCGKHWLRARSRGLNGSSLTPSQLRSLTHLVRPTHPCPVPGCRVEAQRAVCGYHWGWAARFGLNPEKLTGHQLQALGAALQSRPCRVPGCSHVGRSGLCGVHRGRARMLDLDPAHLTRSQLERLASPVAPRPRPAPPDPGPAPASHARCRRSGCERPGIAKGFCTAHYLERMRG